MKKPVKYCKLGRTCLDCGILIDDRSKSGKCHRCNKTGKSNPFYGKTHTNETRVKLKEAHLLRDKTDYTAGFCKQLSSDSHKRRGETIKNKWKKYDSIKKESIISNWIEAGRNKKETGIEKAVAKILEENQISYSNNIKIGIYNSDFVIGNKIIECFGDYWHNNPKFNEPNPKNNKDKIKIDTLIKIGYSVLVLWENDIKTDLPDTVKKIKEFLNIGGAPEQKR